MTPATSTAAASHRFFYALDGIRGIAAVLVALRHTTPFWGDVQFQESYLAVDVFFLLSGLVIANAYEGRLEANLSALHFAWIRVVRIYPLYFLGIVIALAGIHFGLWNRPLTGSIGVTIVLALLLLPNLNGSLFPLNGPAWSLLFELLINVAYAYVIKMRKQEWGLRATAIVSALGLLLIVSLAPSHCLDVGWKQRTLIGGFFRVGYSFSMGVLIYHFYRQRRPVPSSKLSQNIKAWLVFAAVGLILTASPSRAVQPYFDFLSVVFVFPYIIYLATSSQPSGISAQILRFLGGISYGVYALHFSLGTVLPNALRQKANLNVENYAPWIGALLLVVLAALCWALDQVYDAPVRKRLNALWPIARRGDYDSARSRAVSKTRSLRGAS